MTDTISILTNQLLDDLNKLSESSFESFNGRELIIDYSLSPNLKDSFAALISSIDVLPQSKLSIIISDSKFEKTYFYYDENDFIKRCKLKTSEFEDSHVIFINPKGINSNQLAGNELTNKFSLNFLTFKEIQTFMANTRELVSFNDNTNRVFTIITKSYGVFRVGYALPDYKFFYSINLKNKFQRLNDEFVKKEFIQFFKEILVTSVHNKKEADRFKTIIRQLDSILDLTTKDFEAYISNFAIDKIKANFKEERESYFDNIDRSLSSIEKQVVSFPLTFAASIFGVYKVQNRPGIILLILLAYLLYTVIAILILRITSFNVKCLKEDVDSEELAIKNGFNKIYSNFESEFKKIRRKIQNLRIIIRALYAVLISLFIIFVLFASDSMSWIDLKSWSEFIDRSLTQSAS